MTNLVRRENETLEEFVNREYNHLIEEYERAERKRQRQRITETRQLYYNAHKGNIYEKIINYFIKQMDKMKDKGWYIYVDGEIYDRKKLKLEFMCAEKWRVVYSNGGSRWKNTIRELRKKDFEMLIEFNVGWYKKKIMGIKFCREIQQFKYHDEKCEINKQRRIKKTLTNLVKEKGVADMIMSY